MRRTGLVVVAGLLCQIAAQSDCAALFSSVVKAHDFENSVPEHLLRSDEATFNLTRSRVAHLSSAFRDHAERAYAASRRSANATATAAERAGIVASYLVGPRPKKRKLPKKKHVTLDLKRVRHSGRVNSI